MIEDYKLVIWDAINVQNIIRVVTTDGWLVK